MAYTGTSSTKRTIYSGGSGGSFQQQPTYSQQQPTYSQQHPSYSHAQEHHVYEEQPYYANEQTISRQSVGADTRRTGGVCNIFIS